MTAIKQTRRQSWTASKAEYLRKHFAGIGNRYIVSAIETDEMPPPSGTTDYEGRTLTFTVIDHDMTWRILVEDVSLDTDVRS